MKLTKKQEAYAQHYAIHRDAKEAYKAAGYSWKRMQPESFRVTATKLASKPTVALRIAELQKRIKDRAEHVFDITAERILQELAAIGFANMKDFMKVDEGGQPELNLSDLQRHQWAAIGEITIEDIETGARTGKRTKFKLLDKKGALVELGKYVGIVSEKHEHTHKHEFIDDAASQLDAGIDIHLARARSGAGIAATSDGSSSIN